MTAPSKPTLAELIAKVRGYSDVQLSCHWLADEAEALEREVERVRGDKGRLEALLAEMAQCAEWSLAAGDPHDWRKGLLIVRDRALDATEALERERDSARAEIRLHKLARANIALRAQVEALTSERDELRSQHHRQDCGDVVRALVERNAVLFRQVEAMRAVVEAVRDADVHTECIQDHDATGYPCPKRRVRDALARLDASGKGGAERT